MFNPMQMMGAGGNNNIMQMMMQMMQGKGNPQQIMSQMAQGNPLFQRAQEMAKGKSPEELEQTIKNLCGQRGIDYDQALAQFKQMSGK